MKYKRAGFVAIGAVAGFLAAMFVFRAPKGPVSGAQPSIGYDLSAEVAGTSGKPERSPVEAASDSGMEVPSPASSFATDSTSVQAMTERFHAASRQRHIDRLLAAGYPMDRIEWLMNRLTAIREEQRRRREKREAKGLPIDEKGFQAMIDDEAELREELGEAEYERYLLALGRPIAVGIEKVFPGSLAESAGLRQEDEIFSFDGKRVFGAGQLSILRDKARAGEPVTLDVRRDGQMIQLVVPESLVRFRARVDPPHYFQGDFPDKE